MALAILPDLNIELHSRLRGAWLDAIEQHDEVPLLASNARTTVEAVLLERDVVRAMRVNPGPEVIRRFGDVPAAQPGLATIGNARLAERAARYSVGLHAVLRLVTLGRSLGANDLSDLIAEGPSGAAFGPYFDDAVTTVMQVQRDLGVRWGERIRERDIAGATRDRVAVRPIGESLARMIGPDAS